MKKEIDVKNLKKGKNRFIFIFVAFIALLIIGAFTLPYFAKDQVFKVSEEKIMTEVNKKIPMIKTLPVKNKLLNMASVKEVKAKINNVDIKLEKDLIKANVDGVLLVKNQFVKFNIKTKGKPSYNQKDWSFYYLPAAEKGLEITFEKKPSELILSMVEKVSKTLHAPKEDVQEDKPKGLKSFMLGKAKEKLKQYKVDKLAKNYLKDKEFSKSLDYEINKAIDKSFRAYLKRNHVYTLKSEGIQSLARIGLQDLTINPKELVITVSITKVLIYYVTAFLFSLMFFVAFIAIFIAIKDTDFENTSSSSRRNTDGCGAGTLITLGLLDGLGSF